jgi:hypothetical protein
MLILLENFRFVAAKKLSAAASSNSFIPRLRRVT